MRVFVAYVSRSSSNIIKSLKHIITGWFLGKRKSSTIVLYSNEEAATAVRALVAEIWRETEGKFNIVVIKSSNDHDASGIKDTMEDMGVSLMLYHLKIQILTISMSSIKLTKL